MTYRNKLLLKRGLLVLAILAAVAALVLLIGFIYMGRFVIYTEAGAVFSFEPSAQESAPVSTLPVPETIELVTGEPISANEVIGDTTPSLEDSSVSGFLLDYKTLSEGTSLSQLDLEPAVNNTLVLQMRAPDKDILSTEPVRALIQRAKSQDVHLVAMISCLSDSTYARNHPDQALKADASTLWVTNDGTCWLDPSQDAVIDYLAGIIRVLSDMGFQEVILDDFFMPSSDLYMYQYNGQTNADITTAAYGKLLEATLDQCKLGILVWDPELGHQALESADRLYVYYTDGSSVKRYAEDHPDQYLVFITDSHDTRFENYGRIRSDSNLFLSAGLAYGGEKPVSDEEAATDTADEDE